MFTEIIHYKGTFYGIAHILSILLPLTLLFYKIVLLVYIYLKRDGFPRLASYIKYIHLLQK